MGFLKDVMRTTKTRSQGGRPLSDAYSGCSNERQPSSLLMQVHTGRATTGEGQKQGSVGAVLDLGAVGMS